VKFDKLYIQKPKTNGKTQVLAKQSLFLETKFSKNSKFGGTNKNLL
jgi:hypothetical protein